MQGMLFLLLCLMDSYVLVITIIGIASLGMAWFPNISRKTRISYAVFYVVLGMGLFSTLKPWLPEASPMAASRGESIS